MQIGRGQGDGREGVAPAGFDADPDVKAQLVVDRGDLDLLVAIVTSASGIAVRICR